MGASGVSNRLLLTMASPHEAVYVKKAVDSVTVPGAEGTFTVTNNHSLIVSQLRAGVITVRDGQEAKDYFISDGFLFFNHPTDGSGCCTAELSALECVPTSALDKARAQLGAALVNQVIKAAE